MLCQTRASKRWLCRSGEGSLSCLLRLPNTTICIQQLLYQRIQYHFQGTIFILNPIESSLKSISYREKWRKVVLWGMREIDLRLVFSIPKVPQSINSGYQFIFILLFEPNISRGIYNILVLYEVMACLPFHISFPLALARIQIQMCFVFEQKLAYDQEIPGQSVNQLLFQCCCFSLSFAQSSLSLVKGDLRRHYDSSRL